MDNESTRIYDSDLYLVSAGKYALTKKDRKEGQKVIPVAYVEAVAEWIAKRVEDEQ